MEPGPAVRPFIRMVAAIFSILLIAFYLGVRLTTKVSPPDNQVNRTAAAMKQIESQINMFKLDHGRYPATLEELRRRPGNVDPAKWPSEGYLSEPAIEEWGRPFVYTVPGARDPFDLVSLGKDGKPGGEGLDASPRDK